MCAQIFHLLKYSPFPQQQQQQQQQNTKHQTQTFSTKAY